MDDSGNLSLKTPNVALPMALVKVAELPSAPKLDGVYNAEFFGNVACVMTFDNGKLTVEDRGMSGIQNGEYAYTVKDGVITVTKTDGSDCGFQITMDDSGNLSLKTPNVALPMALKKVAELGGGTDTTDKAAADAVIAEINAIGTVTSDSKAAIEAARAGYDKLTDTQKNLVTNYETLTKAEADLKALQDQAAQDAADKAAADAVIAEINAIGTVTSDSKAAIEAARAGYDKLTDTQKKLVTNYETLTKAEKAFAAIPSTGDNTIFVFAILALSMTAVVVLVSRKRAF
jgi:LPXTG-motif cell wall-anchored protein